MSKRDLREFMILECIGEWAPKMQTKGGCLQHLAYTAPDRATIADLSNMCDNVNKRFTVSDARELCTALTDVHAAFWPRYHAASDGP